MGTTERAYTVREIDEMRQSVECIVHAEQGPVIRLGQRYMPDEYVVAISARARMVEDRLGTYLTAGIEPTALHEIASSRVEAKHA